MLKEYDVTYINNDGSVIGQYLVMAHNKFDAFDRACVLADDMNLNIENDPIIRAKKIQKNPDLEKFVKEKDEEYKANTEKVLCTFSFGMAKKLRDLSLFFHKPAESLIRQLTRGKVEQMHKLYIDKQNIIKRDRSREMEIKLKVVDSTFDTTYRELLQYIDRAGIFYTAEMEREDRYVVLTMRCTLEEFEAICFEHYAINEKYRKIAREFNQK